MPTIEEIRKLKEYFVDDLYLQTRLEQKTDDTFYKDTFEVPQISNPNRIQRTGRGSRLIDSPAEHIITQNPQVFREILKQSKGAGDSALKVSKELNRHVEIMRKQNPNPFKEFVKNLLLRGEAWVHPVHNEGWVTGKRIRKGLPIIYTIPEPMVIYADPNEDEMGIPSQVIVFYERLPWIIKSKYPNWTNPKHAGTKDGSKTVMWMEYWSADQMYFEADSEPVLKGKVQPNLYKLVPYSHALSGFGKSSPEGKMEDLIVGRLRKSRDLLIRECAMVSDIDSTFHLFANRSIDVQPIDDQHEIPEGFEEEYEMGPGLIHRLPAGLKVERAVELLPEPQVFQYLYSIEAQLEREDPLVLAGLPVGESGRLQDIVGASAMARYDTIVENTENAFATAFGMGLQILEKIPTLMPEEHGLTKDDIGGYYEVNIELKASDPIEADRKATLGSRLYQQGQIDLKTNLVKYQGYTEDEADEIITNILVDKVTFQSPDVAELMGLRLAEKSGMAEDLAMIKERRKAIEAQGMQQPPSPTEGARRTGEVGTELGREMIDESLRGKGARSAPERYTRG